tara:strand:+ start:3696 stop:5552 length:1857 start_codon:yes stop_codon:yes gene_type:complete
MPDNIQSYKVVSSGGLDASQNHLLLSEEAPGVAIRLVNYEVSLFGGYRRINGFVPYGGDSISTVGGDESEGKVYNLSIYYDDSLFREDLLAARKDRSFSYAVVTTRSVFNGNDDNSRPLSVTNSTSLGVYLNGSELLRSEYTIDMSNNAITLNTAADPGDVVVIDNHEYSFFRFVPLAGWSAYSTGLTHPTRSGTFKNEVFRIRSAQFNFGGGNKICFVDGVNNALVFDGVNWKYLDPSNAGTNADPGGVMCFEAPEVVEVYENHLWLGGDLSDASNIAYSSPRNENDWTAAGGSGQLPTGFDLVQLKPFRDTLFVFGGNSIKKVVSSSGANTPFVMEQVTANVGCVARDSVLELGGDLVFLAPDGLRPVAGTSRIGDVELETISKRIQPTISQLPELYDLKDLCGCVIRNKSQLRYFISNENTNLSDAFGIIGGLRTSDQRLGWEFGELLGIRASCTTSGYIGGTEFVFHGDFDGKVYRQEQGNTFADENIVAVYSTPFYDFGDTEIRKIMRKVNTFIRAEGPLEMNLAVVYDYFSSDVSNPTSYLETSKGQPVQYRGQNINYNSPLVTYGGSEKPILHTPIEGSGNAVQITYVTTGDFAPYSIQGLVFEFTISGRR